jgi:hypothetical protein
MQPRIKLRPLSMNVLDFIPRPTAAVCAEKFNTKFSVMETLLTVYTLHLTHQFTDHCLQKSIPVNQFIEIYHLTVPCINR